MELSECYRLLETAALIHDIGNPLLDILGKKPFVFGLKNGPLYACWSDFRSNNKMIFLTLKETLKPSDF